MGKRQTELEGMERAVVKEVSAAAEAYRAQRDKRMALSKKEKEAKDALIEAMKGAKLKVYKDDTVVPPIVVTLSAKDNVKVESIGDDDGEEGGEE